MDPAVKIVLLFLAMIASRAGLRPPNPPPDKEDNVYKGQLFEKIVLFVSFFLRWSVITCLSCECAVLLSLYNRAHPSRYPILTICPGASPNLSTASTPSLSFIVGIAILLSSAALRVWCYHTLGGLFTYQVTVKRDHELITSGPYAYVRHPGYTSGAILGVGVVLTCFSSGSYINECHIMATIAAWWVRVWIFCSLFSVVSLWKRGSVEDELLESFFGETWDCYRQAVPCRFVPGVI